MLTVVIIGVILAFIFDFANGWKDSANSVATIVATRVLRPLWAVAWAAMFNFFAVFLLDVKVARTIGKGVIDPSAVNEIVILAAFVGAIIWTVWCTYLGLPISVSHSLVGGLLGAGLTHGGISIIGWRGVGKIALFMVLSPIIGMVLGYILVAIVNRVLFRVNRRVTEAWFKRFQLISAAFYSLGHGTADAQKTMGAISVLLFTAGMGVNPEGNWLVQSTFDSGGFVPNWVVFGSHAVIALGTLIGGWRVIRTLGIRLTHIKPREGFCAEGAAAASLISTAYLGIPVSTTHTITGAIMGVGIMRRLSAVRWGVAANIVAAWVLTIPASAITAGLVYILLRTLFKYLGT